MPRSWTVSDRGTAADPNRETLRLKIQVQCYAGYRGEREPRSSAPVCLRGPCEIGIARCRASQHRHSCHEGSCTGWPDWAQLPRQKIRNLNHRPGVVLAVLPQFVLEVG